MQKIFLILAVAFLLSEASQAEIINYFTLNQAGERTFDEPDFIRSIKDYTANIDSLELAHLKLNIVIQPEGDNASFDTGNIIEIPRTMRFTNEYGTEPVYKTTADALAVYAHEYGHAIFDNYIVSALPEYIELRKIKTEISYLSLLPFVEKLNPNQSLENRTKIQSLNKRLIADKELLRLFRLTLYYHELFADTLAVYITNDKSAIYEALFNPNIPVWKKTELSYIEARDFAMSHPLETWTNDSEHGLFSPLRSQIGRAECWPATAADKTKKLKYLIILLLSDLKEKNASKLFPTIEDNRKLIEKFKEICN